MCSPAEFSANGFSDVVYEAHGQLEERRAIVARIAEGVLKLNAIDKEVMKWTADSQRVVSEHFKDESIRSAVQMMRYVTSRDSWYPAAFMFLSMMLIMSAFEIGVNPTVVVLIIAAIAAAQAVTARPPPTASRRTAYLSDRPRRNR